MHKVTLCMSLYELLVLDFGNALAIASPTWSFWTSLLISSTIEVIVRCLLSYRLYVLSKRWWIAVPIVFLSLCHYVAGLVYVIIEAQHTTIVTTKATDPLLFVAGACGCCTDISLAVSQTFILRRLRSGLEATNKIVQMIVFYSINTCIITCLVTIACVITYAISLDGQSLIWLALLHQLGTLLFNALLATYNARGELREAMYGNRDHITLPLATLSRSRGDTFGAEASNDNRPIRISVSTSPSAKVDSISSHAFVDSKSVPSISEDTFHT
ncbi:hypothetical protein CERSUDRAFT_83073 [Gelatoporia subvermispora B]|uniref:DUF6534 domain-containing protein n=1 Tax=Ceriporiopsis subvermispora (strain B) TaxID=914234 RepID=M2RER2_CERS8|nr:hypothetical protein CERSUDRAFT_83073 [Gelatoporia subvermispora B]